MMRALALSIAVLLAGAVVAAGLFWAFLNTPESTAMMLGVSLALIAGMVAVLGAALGVTLAACGGSWGTIGRGTVVRGVLAFLPALLVVLAGWFAVGSAIDGLVARSGEISAWFLATLDWPDVRPLIRAAVLVAEWLRWIVIPFAALIWLGRTIVGRQPPTPYAWRPQASAATRLLLATAVAGFTLWAPLTFGLYWTPRGLPPTWIEPAIAAAKLAAIAVVGAIGLSLIVGLAARLRPDG
jgi:hypothetical protein